MGSLPRPISRQEVLGGFVSKSNQSRFCATIRGEICGAPQLGEKGMRRSDILSGLMDAGSRRKTDEAAPSRPNQELTLEGCPLREEVEREVIKLHEENFTSLFRYGYTITRNKDLSQDALQEIFLRYFACRMEGQHIRNSRAWLFRVLRNYLLDRLKDPLVRDGVKLEAARYLPDLSRSLEDDYEQTELSQRALLRLSPRERECLRLRTEGLRYKEIAEVLEISLGTVGALLTRGVNKLRGTIRKAKVKNRCKND
jgi:RNA polymerase sigma-70 factor (ECF subfamily)